MRHAKHRHTLGVTKEHRAAMMGHLATALLTHGRIKTTLAKAKALRPFIERIISLAKRAQNAPKERSVYLRRLAIARVRDKDAIKLLFNERAEEFANRNGGYTRIYKLAERRKGDAAEMALIELISGSDEGYPKRKRRTPAKKAAQAAPTAAPVAEESPVDETPAAPAEEAPAPDAEAPEPTAEAPSTDEEPKEEKS